MAGLRPLELNEALKDSPRFRDAVREHESQLRRVDTKLREIIRLSTAMVEYGKSYIATFYNMVQAMTDMNNACFSTDAEMMSSFGLLSMAFEQVMQLHKNMVQDSHTNIAKQLAELLRREVCRVDDVRAQYDRLWHNVDDELARNAGNKEEEVTNELVTVTTAYAHTSIDYAATLNIVDARINHEILIAFRSLLTSSRALFTDGNEFFTEFAKDDEYVERSIAQSQAKSRKIERKMQDRHMLVPKELYTIAIGGISPDADVVMEGYLFKRATNAFKQWNRRWFVIRHNQLLYRHRDGAHPQHTYDEYTVIAHDLRLCMVREGGGERECSFDLITPNKVHMLQADSKPLCRAWIKAIQRTTVAAIHDDETATSKLIPNSSASRILAVDGNRRCADCAQASPQWLSINIGVTLCINCAGIHRSFGVCVSKVRSLYLDAIDEEHVNVVLGLGNVRVNAIYLAHVPDVDASPAVATADSPRAVRESWITAKYVHKRFVTASSPVLRSWGSDAQIGGHLAVDEGDTTMHESCSDTRLNTSAEINELNVSFLSACHDHRLLDIARLLVLGADINCESSRALHMAVRSSNGVCVEYLLLNGVHMNSVDGDGQTALHIACHLGLTSIVCLLLKRGAAHSLEDTKGETPLDLAMVGTHADIVTLLRVTKLRDDQRDDSAMSAHMDATVSGVMHDISSTMTH